MVIDTSALVAVLFQENEAERILRAISHGTPRLVSAGTLLEASIVIQGRFRQEGTRDLDLLVMTLHLTIVPVTEQQVGIGRQAYRQYGKGQGHPASLNFGDCFAYALAIETGEPLLFKGNGFSRTDVATVPY